MARLVKTSPDIDGFTYRVTQLGAKDARSVLVKLTKLGLPAVGSVISSAKGSKPTADTDLSELGIDQAAALLSDKLDEGVVSEIMDKLAENTEVLGKGFGAEGAPLDRNFDDHFAGRMASMLKWVGFALKVNYADFFEGWPSVAALIAKLRAPAASPASPSPTTSTGSSGGQ